MTLNEYLEELQQVPKKLCGALLEKLLETDEVQAAKRIAERAKNSKIDLDTIQHINLRKRKH